MERFKELVEVCRGRRLHIQTHNFPDPDAIGAAFGLQRLLERHGVTADICYDGQIDKLTTSKMLEMFQIKLRSREEIEAELRDTDAIVLVDCQKDSGNTTDLAGEEIAAIDHHPTFKPVKYLWSDIRPVGACCSIVTDYYAKLGEIPDRNVATAMLYGLKIDTLQFTRGVSETDIAAFGFLFPYADRLAVTALERNNIEFQDLKAYGAAIESIRLYGCIGFSRIPFACPDAMVAILADFILSLMEVEVAVVYCERYDGIKFSVRSEREEIHAGRITRGALAGLGSGGGHASMAGGLIPACNIPRLGNYPDDYLRDMFLRQMKDL